jgi:hypothetical protein
VPHPSYTNHTARTLSVADHELVDHTSSASSTNHCHNHTIIANDNIAKWQQWQ